MSLARGVRAMDGAPEASMGATHASHGLTREGQPRIVSRRRLRNRINGVPRGGHICCARRAAHILHVPHLRRPHRRPPQHRPYIEVRIVHNSGKNFSSNALARYDTPPVPPVPGLYPMIRSTVFK
jgi:hypothetical protein